ncbi:hypothetical protein [Anaeromyxobacter sp. PSR-1]|uniref:hypothetical protein n=1 Tax=Anaeromyxobacter sp. PSR-1 TaxID=1300915 RepID=UPI0005DFA5FC|nr:hypothetical protein [Anaeromyxobacter sp. PSR-1]GAO01231.1 hypothetical protein PSR1_00083 [Anaeromyxobacter sp. PSR-1]
MDVRIDAAEVVVTYRDGDKVQQCGRSERVLEPDVEAWVFDQADAGDMVETARGRFVRQAAPSGGVRA